MKTNKILKFGLKLDTNWKLIAQTLSKLASSAFPVVTMP